MGVLCLGESEIAVIARDLEYLRQVSDAFWRRAVDSGFADYERMLNRGDCSLLREAVSSLAKAYESGSLLEERAFDLIADGSCISREYLREVLLKELFNQLSIGERAIWHRRTMRFREVNGAVTALLSFGIEAGILSSSDLFAFSRQLEDMNFRMVR